MGVIMVKFMGALLVIGAGFLAGLCFSQRLTERCRLLKIWFHSLEIMKAEIHYQNKLLPEVFQRVALLIGDPCFQAVFKELAGLVEFGSGAELSEVWSKTIAQTGSLSLTKSDYVALHELGNYLGSTDREDQCERIKLCQSRLQNNIQIAEIDRDKKINLYRYLGFAAGALLVLFLL
jgi:stage III sporulation protein AB